MDAASREEANTASSQQQPAAPSVATAVLCKFLRSRGIGEEIKDFTRPSDTNIGQVQARLQQKLKIPAVFVCLHHAASGEAFLPLPDMTLEEAAELFGVRDAEGKPTVTFSAATTTEAFAL